MGPEVASLNVEAVLDHPEQVVAGRRAGQPRLAFAEPVALRDKGVASLLKVVVKHGLGV